MWLWWQQDSARSRFQFGTTSADHALLMIVVVIFIAAIGLIVGGSLIDQVVPVSGMS